MRDDGSKRPMSCTVYNLSLNMHPRNVGVGHFACEGRHTGVAIAKQLCAFFLHERGIYVYICGCYEGDSGRRDKPGCGRAVLDGEAGVAARPPSEQSDVPLPPGQAAPQGAVP